MQSYRLIPLVVLPIITVLAVLIYTYVGLVNEMFGSTVAGNILLMILIGVDAIGGVLVPFIIRARENPTIKFEGLFVNNEPAYFLRVRKTKGEHMVESCEAFLTVEGTEVRNAPTVWSHGSVRRYDIGGHMDLRLFSVKEGRFVGEAVAVGKWIIFPSANVDQGFAEHPTHYEDFINKELTVEIHAKNGHLPKPFTKKIADIIKDAKREGV